MKIKIIPNPQKKWAFLLSKKLKDVLIKNGHLVVDDKADVTICIGGDGTILYANHDKIISGAVLAIGSDSSQICQINKKEWKTNLFKFLNSSKRQACIMLKATVGKEFYFAVNDVVLHTHDYRLIRVSIKLSQANMHTQKFFDGDGIIISTPIGSTAYAYSAGGSVIKPFSSKKIGVVPICPYKRVFKPLVANRHSLIHLHSDRTADLIVDGIYLKRLKPKEKLTVKSESKIVFVR